MKKKNVEIENKGFPLDGDSFKSYIDINDYAKYSNTEKLDINTNNNVYNYNLISQVDDLKKNKLSKIGNDIIFNGIRNSQIKRNSHSDLISNGWSYVEDDNKTYYSTIFLSGGVIGVYVYELVGERSSEIINNSFIFVEDDKRSYISSSLSTGFLIKNEVFTNGMWSNHLITLDSNNIPDVNYTNKFKLGYQKMIINPSVPNTPPDIAVAFGLGWDLQLSIPGVNGSDLIEIWEVIDV